MIALAGTLTAFATFHLYLSCRNLTTIEFLTRCAAVRDGILTHLVWQTANGIERQLRGRNLCFLTCCGRHEKSEKKISYDRGLYGNLQSTLGTAAVCWSGPHPNRACSLHLDGSDVLETGFRPRICMQSARVRVDLRLTCEVDPRLPTRRRRMELPTQRAGRAGARVATDPSDGREQAAAVPTVRDAVPAVPAEHGGAHVHRAAARWLCGCGARG